MSQEKLIKGIIQISKDFVVTPSYTFEQFRNTVYYHGQDRKRIINLNDTFEIEGRAFRVSLFFRDSILYMLSLVCCDVSIAFREEEKRKAVHDQILAQHGIEQKKVYGWGSIVSNYDPRGNVSSIDIIYTSDNA